MAVTQTYAEFLKYGDPVAETGVPPTRIPDSVMMRVLVPSVLILETAWLALVGYSILFGGMRLLDGILLH